MNTRKSVVPNGPFALILLIVFVGIILAAFFIRSISSRNEIIVQTDQADIVTGEQRFSIEDTDKDGLKDWEENLWNTDPNNKDTDGDGTFDGIEVDAGRSPTVPAPGDTLHLVAVSQVASSTSSTTQKTPNQTELFSEVFITSYLNSAIVGDPFESQLDTLSKVAVPKIEKTVKYSTVDLTLQDQVTEQSVHGYGNAAGQILKRNEPGVENELIIVLKSMRDDDTQYIKEILKTSEAYRKNAKELLTLPAPKNVAEEHVEMINAFLSVAQDIELMSSFYDDPLLAIAGFDSYFEKAARLIDALNSIGQYLNTYTTFSVSEGGYIFVSNL